MLFCCCGALTEISPAEIRSPAQKPSRPTAHEWSAWKPTEILFASLWFYRNVLNQSFVLNDSWNQRSFSVRLNVTRVGKIPWKTRQKKERKRIISTSININIHAHSQWRPSSSCKWNKYILGTKERTEAAVVCGGRRAGEWCSLARYCQASLSRCQNKVPLLLLACQRPWMHLDMRGARRHIWLVMAIGRSLA